MKKLVSTIVFFSGVLLLHTHAVGQTSKTNFASSGSYVTMAEQNGIKAMYMNGSMGSSAAMCLNFTNTTDKSATFSWTLKDNKGNIVYSSKPVQLAAGQTFDIDHNPALKNRMIFIVKQGVSADSYKVEIDSKN